MCVGLCLALRSCGNTAWVGAGEENGRALFEPRTPSAPSPDGVASRREPVGTSIQHHFRR